MPAPGPADRSAARTVLITGAAGNLGSILRRELAGHYRLRLTDRVRPAAITPDEEFVAADLRDLAAVEAAMAGMDAVVHLGAIPGEDHWEELLQANVMGTFHVFEAAHRAGVGRIVFASSNHVTGFYPSDETIDADRRVRPDSRYGVTKALGEAVGSLYADKYGLRVLSIRIGHVVDTPVDRRDLATWCSGPDLAQLVRIGLDHPDVHNEIIWGVSDNTAGFWHDPRAASLGYRPSDRSDAHVDGLADPGAAGPWQGGSFPTSEGGGHPAQGPPPGTRPSLRHHLRRVVNAVRRRVLG